MKRYTDKSKLFYSFIRNKQKINQVIKQINIGGGKITSNDKEFAQIYVFASVFTKEITIKNYLTEFESRTHGNNIRFTENDVYEI